MARSYQWIFATQSGSLVEDLSRQLGISNILARLLVNRGINDAEQAERFLRPRLDGLHSPSLFSHMKRAVGRIRDAVDRKEHIRVQGDYDVDGTTSTALLCGCLRLFGAVHSYAIPSRESDGYGLSIGAVERARADGVKVIITVDNGIAAVEEIRHARSLGIDVIVTDHHSFAPELPPAFAIIHPRLPEQHYPFKDLCGCGVALKLALGIAEVFSGRAAPGPEFESFVAYALALTAIASVCDVVPLLGENRALTRHGLAALEATRHPGLRALLDVAGVSGAVNTVDIGFKIGPRINAAGRMGEERLAAQLLMTDDYGKALEHATRLDELNRKRQTVERGVTTQAKNVLESDDSYGRDEVVVIGNREWPQGVLGIVASRLVEATGKPSVVLAIDKDGEVRGSGRSTKNFHLLNALKECESLLTRFGGHAVAAGLSMREADIPRLREMMNRVAPGHSYFQSPRPTLDVEALLRASDLNIRLARDVSALEPFGEGNPEPLLALERCRVIGRPKLVGKTARHLSFLLAADEPETKSTAGSRGYKAIGFSLAERLPTLDAPDGIKVVFTPRVSTWSGDATLELEIKDVAGH